jgi:uncharacterized membrane protein
VTAATGTASTSADASGAATATAPDQAYTPPPAATQPAAGGLTENVASMLCYILGLITGILFLVLEPYNRNRNIRFHAFQSIFLHVAWIVVFIVEMVVSAALPLPLMMLSSLLWLVVFLGGLGLWVYMLISAYNGKRVKLPVIGDLAEKQA